MLSCVFGITKLVSGTLALKFLGLITVLICLPLFLECSFFAQYFLKVLFTLQSPVISNLHESPMDIAKLLVGLWSGNP